MSLESRPVSGFRAGWPQGIAPLGLPRIRTCTFAHTAPHIMSTLRDGSLSESAPPSRTRRRDRCCFMDTVPGFDAPAMFPSNGVMTWRPLLSTGSLGMVPPLQRYYGTLRLPAVRLDPFEFFTSRYHRVARGLLPSVVGVPPGARELSVPVSPSGLTMETSGSLRFLGNPGGHCPCSSTPVGSGRLSGPRVSCLTRPPPVSTTKAPGVLYFRGSITRPLTSLSTLRRMGRPTTTQDSLLAAGPALPGGIRTRRVSAKGFRVRVSSSFQSLPDARTPYLISWELGMVSPELMAADGGVGPRRSQHQALKALCAGAATCTSNR